MRGKAGSYIAVWVLMQGFTLCFLAAMWWQLGKCQERLGEYNAIAVNNGPPISAGRTRLTASLISAAEARLDTVSSI